MLQLQIFVNGPLNDLGHAGTNHLLNEYHLCMWASHHHGLLYSKIYCTESRQTGDIKSGEHSHKCPMVYKANYKYRKRKRIVSKA
jgi:hypothetical protein